MADRENTSSSSSYFSSASSSDTTSPSALALPAMLLSRSLHLHILFSVIQPSLPLFLPSTVPSGLNAVPPYPPLSYATHTIPARFVVFVAVQSKSPFFREVTLRYWVTGSRRFDTTYQSDLEESQRRGCTCRNTHCGPSAYLAALR